MESGVIGYELDWPTFLSALHDNSKEGSMFDMDPSLLASMSADKETEQSFDRFFSRYGLHPLESALCDKQYQLSKLHQRWLISSPSLRVDECLRLFSDVFQKPLTQEFWLWKYRDPTPSSLIASFDQKLVAHYGGIARIVSFRGHKVNALQVCDVMVDSSQRAFFSRKGLFFQLATAFLDLNFGIRSDVTLAYGFPSRRHMRLAEHLGVYGEVDTMQEYRWIPLKGFFSFRYRFEDLKNHLLNNPEVDRLWKVMHADFLEATLVQRDASYLHYRYQEHPEHQYDIIGIRSRWSSKLLGMVILRETQDELWLMDLIGPQSSFEMLIDYARQRASTRKKSHLVSWATSVQGQRLPRHSATIEDLDISVPANIWSKGPPLSDLKGRWWLMMGDTDFL